MQRILTRDEALAAGHTRHQIAWFTGKGQRWQRVLPSVFATYTGPRAPRDRLVAALKYAGSSAALGLWTAAALYGLRYVAASEYVHVVVPRSVRVASRDWLRVHPTTREFRTRRVDGLRVCTLARTTVDVCLAFKTLRDVRAVIGDVVQRGLATLDDLIRELAALPQNGSRKVRLAIDDAHSGTRSAPEGGLRDIVRRIGLPMPEFNVPLVVPGFGKVIADALWRAERIIVEIDSREWHLSPADWERTMRRHNALQRAGYVVLHFPPSRIYGDPAGVAAEIRDMVRAAGRLLPA